MSLAGVRVLAVEDDQDTRDLICLILEQQGATVRCVSSVAEALAGIYAAFDPDLILTDMSMPDADGFELLREFRKLGSTRDTPIPVVILSGHSESDYRERCERAGFFELLIKPVDPKMLVSRLEAALGIVR